MSTNWSNPTLSTTYTDFLAALKARDESLATMFDATTDTNLPTGTICWSSANHRFEKWNGASWVNLDSVLTDVLKIANNLSDLNNAATARSNLGLGSLAVASSINNADWSGTDLAVTNGGTGASSAADARTNLGLGSMAVQAANNVAITGGSMSGVAVTISSGSISGITDLAVADGGTGASDASTARTNLGLGSMATQNSNAVSISGGTISGMTSVGATEVDTPKVYAGGADLELATSGGSWKLGVGSNDLKPATDGGGSLGHSWYYLLNVYTNYLFIKNAPDYTINSMGSANRTINYDSSSSTTVREVLCTLIHDLQSKGLLA